MRTSTKLISYISASATFTSFDFSRSDERDVDVNRFMSKHSSDHHLLFCHNLLSHLTIDASSCIKLMPAYNRFKLHRRFDSTLRN